MSAPKSVFLNTPYDHRYQPLFVTLVGTLVCLGQTPRCVLEIKESGQGRLVRIFELLSSCQVSIHDLSRTSSRYNMPFELGLACAISLSGKTHEVVVMDSVAHRLDKTLSDYKGRDPLIHQSKCDQLVTCLLDLFQVPNEPDPAALRSAAKLLRKSAREIANKYHTSTVFRAAAFRALIAVATEISQEKGFIAA